MCTLKSPKGFNLLMYKKGNPSFGRTSALQSALEVYPDLPIDSRMCGELSYWHLVYTRGIELGVKELPSLEQCDEYVGAVESMLQFAVVIVR